MKKINQIKVKNSPKFSLSQDVINDITNEKLDIPKYEEPIRENIHHIQIIKTKKNKPLVIINPEDQSLICTIPIVFKDRLMIAEFPNLLTLYLNNAILSYNHSNQILEETEVTLTYKSGQGIMFSNQTFYNIYLSSRLNIVFYLSITIELLLNSKIPSDHKHKKGDLYFDKKQIEEKLSFKEKLRLVNKILKDENKAIDNVLFDIIIHLYSIRSKLVHPKTYGAKFKNDSLMEDISITFSTEMEKYITSVIKLMDIWEPGLISYDDSPH